MYKAGVGGRYDCSVAVIPWMLPESSHTPSPITLRAAREEDKTASGL